MEYNRAFYQGMSCAVTGAASGIGLALCEELLESGAQSVVMADYNRDKLDGNVARLSEQYPGRVKAALCNVTIEDEVKRMVAEATAFGGGKLDLLINCAGAAFSGKFAEEPGDVIPGDVFRSKVCSNDDWKRAFDLNFYGALYGCRAAIPQMAARKSGHILNIISGIAFSPMAYQSMYAATKAALCALSLSLRYEFWDDNIQICAATPGTTATAIFTSVGTEAPPEAQTPHQSASRILHYFTSNPRVIMGDDSDAMGGKNCFFPDEVGHALDDVYNNFAKQRRSGDLSFVSKDDSGNVEMSEKAKLLVEIMNAPADQAVELTKKLIAIREPYALDKAYYAGKTAAVTGGASGVGLALGEKLLECGARKVVLADYNKDNLDRQVARLDEAYPGKVKGIVCDVSSEEAVKAMIDGAHRFFDGDFDILINCAGIGQRGMFCETGASEKIAKDAVMPIESQKNWQRVFGINFYGELYGCRHALPIMVKQGKGQIVNIISGTAFSPLPYEGIYSSAKAATNLLTLTLRYEYWETGVRFNSATPGTTATAIFGGMPPPESAQTPEQSAIRILTGVARNDRLTCGDDEDLKGSIYAFNCDDTELLDPIFVEIARQRRSAVVAEYGSKQ